MKFFIPFFLSTLFYALGLSAQGCPFYDQLMEQAQKEAKSGNYRLALNSYKAAFTAARDCDLNKDSEINAAIEQIFKNISEQRDRAIRAQIDTEKQRVLAEKAKADAELQREEALVQKIIADSLARKANALVSRLGGDASYDYFLEEGLGILRDELQREVPDLSLVERYLGIAAFAKESPIVQQWLYAYKALYNLNQFLGMGCDTAIAHFKKIQEDPQIPLLVKHYAQKKEQELLSAQQGIHYWEELKQNYNEDTAAGLSTAEWTGLHNGKKIRFLTFLPDDAFDAFVQIKTLKIQLNRLLFLPHSIGNLSLLDNLVVSRNRLMALPLSIGNLAQLRQLKASNNRLQHLPDTLGQLKNLKYLELSNNAFADIPSPVFNLSLEYLDLSHNRIRVFQVLSGALINNLKHLDLSHNLFTSVSNDLGTLQELRFLDLSDNQLRTLPSSISQLQNLEVLDLSNNPDLYINAEDILLLPQLKELYIYNCRPHETLLQKLKEQRPDIRVVSNR